MNFWRPLCNNSGMKLLYTERSPFARKVRMAAQHHDLLNRIELVDTWPADRGAELMDHNPLGKIPVLILNNDRSIIDSPVIAQYFDAIGGADKLIPADALQRTHIHHLEALADGALDAAVLVVLETWRPEEKRWQGQVEKQLDNLRRTLVFLEKHADFFNLPFSVAHLSAGAMIAYIYGRLPAIGIEEDWLKDAPQLAMWYDHFRLNPLMLETAPKGGWK